MLARQSGQTVMEYVILIVIILAALLVMQVYMKRGISGRWQAAFDDIGDQYDPLRTNGLIRHTLLSNSMTVVNTIPTTINGVNGYFTMRTDTVQSSETKTGSMQVGN